MISTRLPPRDTAFFLDFDGTLAELVSQPDRAAIHPEALAILQELQSAADGAIAVVSGRSIEQLDQMLFPLRLPLAGVHGAERRDASGRVRRVRYNAESEGRITASIADFVNARPGLLMEKKPGAVALHYRQRPELEAESRDFADALARQDPLVQLIGGKKVMEFKLSSRTKGDAIREFMAEAPFAGRRAFFAGDDATDEAGFAVVNGMGGISMKIGPGASAARHRKKNIPAFLDWLAHAALASAPMTRKQEGT